MPTLVSAGAAAALLSLAVVIVNLSGQVSAHHQAQVAADLAAIAAATAVYHGKDACPAAEETAGRNGASISGCRIVGADATITATIRGQEVTSTAGPV
ncbi:MAG: flp pilus-assembly TadE/G-like family protein [Corynebacterium sp.]|uniref:Rv3654c family TadE-like protein n=1 Tax=Corynebacterium sp. TaxID=1720 RepID=UPI0026E0AC26|nr:Rv3654c family TadE-like protein [Corynebacterium sp.]MDO5668503.1 flp pilus-assembly TadE/G-like family protein [Corynebacterium sp.]